VEAGRVEAGKKRKAGEQPKYWLRGGEERTVVTQKENFLSTNQGEKKEVEGHRERKIDTKSLKSKEKDKREKNVGA